MPNPLETLAPDRSPRPATGQSQLVELFAPARDGAALGFALAGLPKRAPILWVQDRMSGLEMGRPSGLALARFGADPAQVILAAARDAKEVLWTMEEGLRCTALGAVLGEIWGAPRALDFTATKRLALRAEAQGIRTVLIRFGATPDLSAARQRWHIASAPAAAHPHDPRAPGAPRWRAEMFRARDGKPGTWMAAYDAQTHRLDLSAASGDPALAAAPLRRTGAGGA